MSSPSLSPGVGRTFSLPMALYLPQCGWAGGGPTGCSQASRASGNAQGTSWGLGCSHSPLGAFGGQRVPLAAGWRGLMVCGAAEAGAVVMQRVYGRSLLSGCLPCSCLSCSEGGRGRACSRLGRAAPWDTAPPSLQTPHTALLLIHHNSQRGHWASLFGARRLESLLFSTGDPPSGRCSWAGPGWGQPLHGCGELRLGVNCI